MKFTTHKASEYDNFSEISISSLDELLKLIEQQKENDQRIIIEKRSNSSKNSDFEYYKVSKELDWKLTIYDDYLE